MLLTGSQNETCYNGCDRNCRFHKGAVSVARSPVPKWKIQVLSINNMLAQVYIPRLSVWPAC